MTLGTGSVTAGASVAQFASLAVGKSVSQVASVAGRPSKLVSPITWTARANAPGTLTLRAPSAGNGAIVAASSASIYVSTDGGHTFTSKASALSPLTVVAAYLGGSTFVMGARSGDFYLSTNNGASWGAATAFGGTFGTANSVGACGNPAGVGIVWGVGSVWARTINAGATWTSPGSAFSTIWYSMIWDGSQFVAAVNDGAPAIYTSPDGATWTKACTLPGAYANTQVVFDPVTGLYLVGQFTGTAQGTAIRAASSPAGLGTAVDVNVFPTDPFGSAICVAGGGKLFAFSDAGTVVNSVDGVNWVTGTITFAPTGCCYDAVNQSFCAVGGLNVSTFP